MEILTIIISLITGAALAAGAAVYFLKQRQQKPDNMLLMMQQQLDGIREQLRASIDGTTQIVNKQLGELTTQLHNQLKHQTGALNDTRKSMDERLDNAARVIGDVQKSMGCVHEALAPVGELRDILKAPKLRGGLGEMMLERILEEMMPASMFTAQYGFKDGERVDAVIKVGEQMVPVDSKFPLDKYHEYLQANNDEAKKVARKGLTTAIKKHITDVAKYIRPDENTYPFAFMYIPSENIYYEMFVGSEAEESLWSHAAKARVFPVSSNTLYMYLQTISFGLKGMQIAEHAKEILGKLEQLQKNFTDIRKNYEKIGTHLKNAQGAYDDTDKRLDKIETKFAALNSEAAPALEEPAKKDDEELHLQ